MVNPPAQTVGVVGNYKHHDIGEEVEWRPALLYAKPLGHRVLPTRNLPKMRKTQTKNECTVQCVVLSLGPGPPASNV